jgi:F-type H+-transporting ATPase subunit gamma
MATLRDIKSRITGVKNTQQITKAMKMVAAARLRRAQDNMINARPYSRKVEELLNNLFNIEKNIQNPLLSERKVDSIAVIVVTSDRGLCGGFNMNVIRAAEDLIKTEYADYLKENKLSLFCVGKKGVDHFTRRNYNISKKFPGIFTNLKFDFASQFMTDLTGKFLSAEYDKLVVVYNRFKSVSQQVVITKQLLPFLPEQQENKEINTGPEYIFEPDKVSIINSLLPKYLNAQIWTILLNSYAAELGARMTAMDIATENAKDLIRTLQITYNKERQASITSEILEIVSGANALKEV